MWGRISQVAMHLNGGGAFASALGLMVMTGLVVTDVILRRLFNAPLIFADEVAGYLLAWVTLLSVGYTLKEGGHIQVMIIIQRLSPRGLAVLKILWCLISIFYTVLLLVMTGQLAWESYQLGAFSPTPSQLPMFPFQMIMPIGCVLLLLQLIVELVQATSAFSPSRPAPPPPGEGKP